MIFNAMDKSERQHVIEIISEYFDLKYLDKYEYMYNKGCDLSFIDKDGNSMLSKIEGNVDYSYDICKKAIDLFVKAGCDVNHRDKYGNTPIISSAKNYKTNANCITILLEYGADPNAENLDGFTALHQCRNIYNLKILIDNGADANKKSKKWSYTTL